MAAEARWLDEAVEFLREHGFRGAERALVLGSGWKAFADRVEVQARVGFGDVPHWPAPRVAGHGGELLEGSLGDGGPQVLCLTGRAHAYEGWDEASVVRPVRTLRRLGAAAFFLSNAAGGVSPDLAPGDVMLIADHLNLTGRSPLVGEHEDVLGPRFPDQTEVWSRQVRAALRAELPQLQEGVYAGLLGPSYETPAEVRMLRALGADAVGMSTVLEAMALRAMGAVLCGASLISNLAAGIADTPLSHDEVLAAGRAAEPELARLLQAFCTVPIPT